MGSATSTPSTPQKRLTVLIDFGDVLSDFEGYFLTEYRDRYPNEPYIPYEKRTAYDLVDDYEKLPGVSKNIKDMVKNIYRTKGFTRDCPEIEGAVRAVKELAKIRGVDVLIVTTPFRRENDYQQSVQEKYEWVAEHFGKDWTDKIIITWDNTVIEGNVLIDDKVNISGVNNNPSWEHVVFTSSANNGVKLYRKKRLNNWIDGEWRIIIEEIRNRHFNKSQ